MCFIYGYCKLQQNSENIYGYRCFYDIERYVY